MTRAKRPNITSDRKLNAWSRISHHWHVDADGLSALDIRLPPTPGKTLLETLALIASRYPISDFRRVLKPLLAQPRHPGRAPQAATGTRLVQRQDVILARQTLEAAASAHFDGSDDSEDQDDGTEESEQGVDSEHEEVTIDGLHTEDRLSPPLLLNTINQTRTDIEDGEDGDDASVDNQDIVDTEDGAGNGRIETLGSDAIQNLQNVPLGRDSEEEEVPSPEHARRVADAHSNQDDFNPDEEEEPPSYYWPEGEQEQTFDSLNCEVERPLISPSTRNEDDQIDCPFHDVDDESLLVASCDSENNSYITSPRPIGESPPCHIPSPSLLSPHLPCHRTRSAPPQSTFTNPARMPVTTRQGSESIMVNSTAKRTKSNEPSARDLRMALLPPKNSHEQSNQRKRKASLGLREPNDFDPAALDWFGPEDQDTKESYLTVLHHLGLIIKRAQHCEKARATAVEGLAEQSRRLHDVNSAATLPLLHLDQSAYSAVAHEARVQMLRTQIETMEARRADVVRETTELDNRQSVERTASKRVSVHERVWNDLVEHLKDIAL
ncbi:hypothetical protein IAQ61_004972 [Plenodomus lingam]|nr:hypothetical protein IAQ61_004972 [Plenodomus lingam]